MKEEHSSGAVLFRGKRPLYLILHYEAGHWDFPKGNVEEGETDVEAALREIEEETGIKDALILPYFKHELGYFYRKGKTLIRKTVVFFLAQTRTKRVKLSYEHIGYGWFPYEKAIERLTYKNARHLLKNADAFLNSRRNLSRIAYSIARCRGCDLWKRRRRTVPGEGKPTADLMFIGQAPGREEDITGRPFVGRAGRLLNSLLEDVGIRREEVFITSLVKCFPPGNRRPKRSEIEACFKHLRAQISVINPKLIILLGEQALSTFFKGASLKDVHGRFLDKDGRRFFPTYHPAAAMRFPRIRKLIKRDFKRLKGF